MEDERTRDGAEDAAAAPGTDPSDETDAPEEGTDAVGEAGDTAPAGNWHDDGGWDPPNVEQRASDDAQAVAVGYPDMDEVIEPGDVNVENALFVVLGVVGTVGLLFYIVQLAG